MTANIKFEFQDYSMISDVQKIGILFKKDQ